MTNYYRFKQNNSGGSFEYDPGKGITTDVIVEAENASQANEIAEKIGIYFDGCETGDDCPCCGDRWGRVRDRDATPTPQIYGEDVYTRKRGIFSNDVFIHRLDGTIEYVKFKTES